MKLPIVIHDLLKLDSILTEVITLHKTEENESNTDVIHLYVSKIETLMNKLYNVISDDQKRSVEFLIEQVCYNSNCFVDSN